jgi:hypothetical protein
VANRGFLPLEKGLGDLGTLKSNTTISNSLVRASLAASLHRGGCNSPKIITAGSGMDE